MGWKWWWVQRKEDEERKLAAEAAFQKVMDECNAPEYQQGLRERDENAWFRLRELHLASARFACYVDGMSCGERKSVSRYMRSGSMARDLKNDPEYQQNLQRLKDLQ